MQTNFIRDKCERDGDITYLPGTRVTHFFIFLLLPTMKRLSSVLVFLHVFMHVSYGFLKSPASLRYLETNAWDLTIGGINIAIDPVLYSPLDFGIPLLYEGKKKVIDGKEELNRIIEKSDYVLLSQGLDDHAHKPTLQQLSSRCPNMPYVCPPSALPLLLSCGISRDKISLLNPGEKKTISKGSTSIDILATTGALVGPPWQKNENGYLIRSKNPSISLYYEPHCMFDEAELARLQADYVISPVVSQELPFYTLVAGGEKVLKLAKLLKSKAIIPMANGELDQSGVLASLLQAKGSEDQFMRIVKEKSPNVKVFQVEPGKQLVLS
jgi:L-ascorbate metabolism protein UlaG (beta-lactamase superfamily)